VGRVRLQPHAQVGWIITLWGRPHLFVAYNRVEKVLKPPFVASPPRPNFVIDRSIDRSFVRSFVRSSPPVAYWPRLGGD
jgi:hypothetical protein